MVYVAVSVLCLFLTHSHTHFLWCMWLLVFYVSSSLIHILTSYCVCGCKCSVSLPHSFTYSLLMVYVAVSVLCLFLTHSLSLCLWRMWLLVFSVSSSLIHILTSYGVCGCQCSVSPPHSFTYSLLMAYVAVSVLSPFLTLSHTHFLWRMLLLVFCVSSSLIHILTSYGVCGCQCSVSPPNSFTYSLLIAYVAVSVLCLFLTHSHTLCLWCMWLLVFCVSSSLIHILNSYGVCGCQCSVSLPHSLTYSLLMAYVAVSVLCLLLTHSHTHFLWRMWLLVFCVSSSLIHILTSYGVCGCQCSVSLPHSFTYSLLMAYVAVSVLCLFLIHSHTLCLWCMWLLVFCVSSSLIHVLTSYCVSGCQWSMSLPHSFTTHSLWRMWLLVFCVSSSLIHILTSYGVCGCQCSVSLPHSFTYSLLMAYVAISFLCLFLTHSHTHFLWRMWLLVFCVSSSLIHVLTSYGVCGCKCSVSLPHSFTYSLLMVYVAVSVLCLLLTHSHTHFLLRKSLLVVYVSSSLIYYSLLMSYVAVSVLCLFITHSHTHFLWRMWLLVSCVSSSFIHILTSYGVCGCQCSVSPPHSFTYSLLMAYLAVSVLCLFLTHSHTHFLWRMWLLVSCFSSSLNHILTSYGLCGCQCSVSLPHSHTHFLLPMWPLMFCVPSSLFHIPTSYGVCGCQRPVFLPHSIVFSLLMVYVAVSVLCLFLTHSHPHFSGVCGCQCSVSLPHSFTYSLLMAYVTVSVLCPFLTQSHTHFLLRMCLFLTHSRTHFLWRMWLLVFCVSSSLIIYSHLMAYVAVSVLCLFLTHLHTITSYCVFGCKSSMSLPHSFTYSLLMPYVSLPHSFTYSLLMAYVAVSVLCLFLTHFLLTPYGVCGCQWSVSPPHSFTYSLLMAYVAVSVLCLFLTHFLLTSYGVCGCQCSVSPPHSLTYSLLMAYVVVSGLCLFLTHSHTHSLWRMWLLVFCVSSSLIHILTPYGVCGCQCSVSLPHSLTYSLLMVYVVVSVLFLFLTL